MKGTEPTALERDAVLAIIDAHTQRCRSAVAACPKWSPVQSEWSRARDACLNIRDDIDALATASNALLPEPDEAQEALAKALEAMESPYTAKTVREGDYPAAVAIFREAMKPKMTPEIAANFREVRQAVFVDNCYAALDRIEAQFRGEGK